MSEAATKDPWHWLRTKQPPPWVLLGEAEAIIAAVGLIPDKREHYEDGSFAFTDETILAGSKWFSNYAFRGRLRLRGWPTEPHGCYPNGPEQDIPAAYFARTRSIYGSFQNGIGRLSFHETRDEIERDKALWAIGEVESEWLDVLIHGPDFYALVVELLPASAYETKSSDDLKADNSPPMPARVRGRPLAYDWERIKKYALEELGHHGGIMPGDDAGGLPTQAALETKVHAFCISTWNRDPSTSTVRSYVTQWIKEHAEAKAGKADK